jgi:hypothetical protein
MKGNIMRRFALVAAAVFASLALATPAYADATAPTDGGSKNGTGSSGNCTGPMAERPPACHNSTGNDGN